MSEYKRRIALGGLLVVALTVGLAFELNSVPGGTTIGTSLSSSSSTQTSTTKAEMMVGANASTVASNGLQLSTFINATDIRVGQKLNISVSVFNTLPTPNGFFPQRSFAYSAPGEAGNWTFYGVPVATWPECTSQFPFNWPLPISVVVLNGNYTAQQLSSIANTSFSIGGCGPASPTIPKYTFEPNSDLINITAQFDSGVGVRPLGQFQLASHFTVSGYWNLTGLAATNTSICEPAVLHACELPASTPFAPGVYTIGVADEWGQVNVLHFQVNGSG